MKKMLAVWLGLIVLCFTFTPLAVASENPGDLTSGGTMKFALHSENGQLSLNGKFIFSVEGASEGYVWGQIYQKPGDEVGVGCWEIWWGEDRIFFWFDLTVEKERYIKDFNNDANPTLMSLSKTKKGLLLLKGKVEEAQGWKWSIRGMEKYSTLSGTISILGKTD